MTDKIFNFIMDNHIGFLLLFLVLFFGKITCNGYEYYKYESKFKEACEAKGGVLFIARGTKGWPTPECRNPNVNIEVEIV